MQIKQFVWDIVDSNSWLIREDSAGLLIDAVESDNLFQEIETLQELTIILTHAHFDHIIGLDRIREIQPACNVISTKKCSENLGNIYRNMSSTATAFMNFYKPGQEIVEIPAFTCAPSDHIFEDEMTFLWYGHEVHLVSLSGHSNDGLAAIIDGKYLFSGDDLMNIPTVTRFPTGSTKRFWSVDIPFLKTKANEIQNVYPGHGSPGNIIDFLSVNEHSCGIKVKSNN